MSGFRSTAYLSENQDINSFLHGLNFDTFVCNSRQDMNNRLVTKFRLIGVPTRDSFSSRVLKVCNPSRVNARY